MMEKQGHRRALLLGIYGYNYVGILGPDASFFNCIRIKNTRIQPDPKSLQNQQQRASCRYRYMVCWVELRIWIEIGRILPSREEKKTCSVSDPPANRSRKNRIQIRMRN